VTAAPLHRVRVAVDKVDSGGYTLFTFERHGEDLTGIAYLHPEEGWKVYVNRCPHVSYSLDFGDGDVMDAEGKFFMCMSHGAMFLPESGECFMGPAYGQRLETLPFKEDGTALVIDVVAEPETWPELPPLPGGAQED